jgi:hypothetical protein
MSLRWLRQPVSMRQVVLILVAPAVVLLVIDVTRMGSLHAKVEHMGTEERQMHVELDGLNAQIDQLDLQVRGVAMLSAVADAGAGQHVVSADAAMEMFTWREQGTGRLCAHWCVRKAGACEDFGPDRCLP